MSAPTPFPAERAPDLRQRLLAAGYAVDRVAERIGTPAHAALGRNQTVPAERVLGDARDPLATLPAVAAAAAGVGG